MIFLRASLFNLCFFGVTTVMCFACLPALLLPKSGVLGVARFYLRVVYFFERHILHLDYEVRGLEHLPKGQSFLVAAKHQSTYETLKLHFIFDDPAIILKKELLNIPIWGWFLARTEPIAINRKKAREASKQIIDGAKRVMTQKRPIIIFPQGTRVPLSQTPQERPYKIGIARMQDATHLPIIPLALNTGKFWPRHSWLKYPGIVIFEFLPAIEPGQPPQEVLKTLEETIESHSQNLL
ncbi:MAG: 1-acyl-sn-glycerol-3-phosphate acyltransferase [Rhodospirillales bacterium]|nr:1-acyl-sn-glycerol-3-phosphate acyltransferase [Rhodospirillales bacterium]MCB9973586.1 1-acyl-sn-glycerol-3-phosphate acyltransferase [Rhodospirillales bacterium]MCB9979610.1 1-acyl-sn-glycerol-3-phosphate acyltransferase [Rhodospirillales bacterium]